MTTKTALTLLKASAGLLLLANLAAGCPDSCFCMDVFVTCSDFKFLDLSQLPPDTDTLVLTQGEVEEIPPGFLATATNLKMLEMIGVNVRVVRGSAFRGLRNVDLFTITSSSFDIVEPDGFSGLAEVNKLHISESSFGRVGRHAFGDISRVQDLRIWSCQFGDVADQAFFNLSNVLSFHFYHNNVSRLGSQVFTKSSGFNDVSFYMNRVGHVSEGTLEDLVHSAKRVVLHANTFACSCDMSWFLKATVLHDYLQFNNCTFFSSAVPGHRTVKMSQVSPEDLCGSNALDQVLPEGQPRDEMVYHLGDDEHGFRLVEEVLDPVLAKHDDVMIKTGDQNSTVAHSDETSPIILQDEAAAHWTPPSSSLLPVLTSALPLSSPHQRETPSDVPLSTLTISSTSASSPPSSSASQTLFPETSSLYHSETSDVDADSWLFLVLSSDVSTEASLSDFSTTSASTISPLSTALGISDETQKMFLDSSSFSFSSSSFHSQPDNNDKTGTPAGKDEENLLVSTPFSTLPPTSVKLHDETSPELLPLYYNKVEDFKSYIMSANNPELSSMTDDTEEQNDFSSATFPEKPDTISHSSEISVTSENKTQPLVSSSRFSQLAINHSSSADEKAPAKMEKSAHAIPYSTEAFEMAAPQLDNSACWPRVSRTYFLWLTAHLLLFMNKQGLV